MAKQEREKIEYEFEDLRRNDDPVPGIVLAQLGFDTDGEADERQEGKQRPDRRAKRKDDDEDDASRDRDDRDLDDDELDDDEEVTLSRKELSRQLTDTRRQVERKARQEIDEAKSEAAEVIGKLEKRLDGIERRGEESSIESEFGPQIADLETKLDAAMEAGNTKEVLALNRQLSEILTKKTLKQHEAKARAAAATTDDDDQSEQRNKRKVPRRVQRWIDKQDWFDDPKEAHVKAYLHKVDADLIESGLSPNEDEYWSKLERKIERKFPGVLTLTMRGGKRDDDDDDDDDYERSRRDRDDEDDEDDRDSRRDRQRKAARRSPVSDGGKGGTGRRDRDDDGGTRRRSGEIRLTKAQISNMRAFGLDPDNKKHVEEYTLEVQRQARTERR